MLQVNPGYSKLVSFCSLFEVENDRHQPYPLMTCQILLPTNKLTDISFAIDDIHPVILEASSKFSLCSFINNIYSIGEKLRLSRNGVNQTVDIIVVDIDNKHQKEFLSPLDEDDFASLSITRDQVEKCIAQLDPEALEALFDPLQNTKLVKYFML